jgi:uncharacterized protein with HEPN domain
LGHRFLAPIRIANDFNSQKGEMIFDAVLMRLQVLGENIKKLLKENREMFLGIEEEVTSIIRLRDLISHHYEKLDTEIVFEICTDYLPPLKLQIERLLNSTH